MNISKYKVTNGKKFKLSDYKTIPPDDSDDKKELKEQLQNDIEEIKKLQEMFFAYDRHAILMLFQAMDASGKDGAIKHVMSGINPQGCDVQAFKAPSAKDYSRDYLFRHHRAMPQSGKIGIHNRSHYEFVLACKVNPEFILRERIPKIKKVKDITTDFWENRYNEITNFESQLANSGLVILKFFLNVSKGEQRLRLLDRIENKSKNWKFEMGDLDARNQWEDYMDAYQLVIQKTAQKNSPWFIIPADDKWFARALIARILKETLKEMDMNYPELDEENLKLLDKAMEQLLEDK